MDSEYWYRALEEIAAWENREPGLLESFGHTLVDPVNRLFGFMLPDRLEKAAVNAIREALTKVASVTENLCGADGARRRVEHETMENGDSLHGADDAARFYWRCGIVEAGAEGAGAGVAGAPGLIVDIPLLFGILIRTVQQIGVCYGFNPEAKAEHAFILKVMNCSTAQNMKIRAQLLAAAKEFEQAVSEAMIRKVAQTMGFRLARRKALQLVPLAGGAIGLAFNAVFVNEVCEAGYMMYRRRYIDIHTQPEPPARVAGTGI